MESATPRASVSKARLWAGWIMTALTVLFLLFDSLIRIVVGLLVWGELYLREVRLGALIPLRSPRS